MATYKSIITYDGTDFQGFQRQKSGLRTVQLILEDGLRNLGWDEKSLKAAGRTDAGVHAKGQVIAYNLSWNDSPQKLNQALNANLPPDVAAVSTEMADADFHPRFFAKRRRYRYTLIVSPVRDPLRERFAWRVWPEPDIEAMREAANVFCGRHDFVAFGSAPVSGGHTIREIFRADWSRQDDEMYFEVEADAFLYRMVRRLVAATIEVGSDRTSVEELGNLLADSDLRWEGPLAKACGLCLDAVVY